MTKKEAAIEAIVALVKSRLAERYGSAKPRLRFDKVALRFVADMRAALGDSVPEGKTLMLTITAPIWLASKTATTLEEKVRAWMARKSTKADLKVTINRNQIRVRLASGGSKAIVNVIGFVHNPGSRAAGAILDAAQSLLTCRQ